MEKDIDNGHQLRRISILCTWVKKYIWTLKVKPNHQDNACQKKRSLGDNIGCNEKKRTFHNRMLLPTQTAEKLRAQLIKGLFLPESHEIAC